MKVNISRVSREETLKHKKCFAFSMAVNGQFVNESHLRSDNMTEQQCLEMVENINSTASNMEHTDMFQNMSYQVASAFVAQAVLTKGKIRAILVDALRTTQNKSLRDEISTIISEVGDKLDCVFDPNQNVIGEYGRKYYPENIKTYDELFTFLFTEFFLDNDIITFYNAYLEK